MFLDDDAERCFIVRHGAAAVAHILDHRSLLDMVVFDPAGPSMSISADNLADFLDSDLLAGDDTPVDSGIDGELLAVELVGEVTGFELPLTSQWGRINLADPVARDRDINALVAEQTRLLGDSGAGLRREIRQWLSKIAVQAGDNGGTRLAFLVEHTRQAAAAVAVAWYYHSFGSPSPDGDLMGHLTDWVLDQSTADDVVVRIDSPGRAVLRRTRIGRVDPAAGIADVSFMNIEYWLAAPDNEHVAHVAFSSPHLQAERPLTRLADNMVLGGKWVFHDADAWLEAMARSGEAR